jgi:hypothetical protein
MKYLKPLAWGLEVAPILAELDAAPELWNQHTLRTSGAAPAHNAVSDIWVRYRSYQELRSPADLGAIKDYIGQPHESVWYDAIDKLPSLRALIFEICRYFEAERLGGVLITRIPPGGEVKPHIDRGWHATYYEKIAVQLRCAPEQAFHFADGEFRCPAGTVYTFDNNQKHWVSNESTVERITAIICVRRDQRQKRLVEASGD